MIALALDKIQRQRVIMEAVQSPIEAVALCNSATVSTHGILGN